MKNTWSILYHGMLSTQECLYL